MTTLLNNGPSGARPSLGQPEALTALWVIGPLQSGAKHKQAWVVL